MFVKRIVTLCSCVLLVLGISASASSGALAPASPHVVVHAASGSISTRLLALDERIAPATPTHTSHVLVDMHVAHRIATPTPVVVRRATAPATAKPVATASPVRSVPVASPVGSVPWQGGSPNTYPYGWCTWGAAHLAYDNVNNLGDAANWIFAARARGMPTGSVPRLNATAVFQPHVQGASAVGHVAHVVAIGANGMFEVEGMSAPYWGVYTFSWVHTGPGTDFIY